MAKRIALLGPMHPYRGGIAHFTEAIHQGLQERGHEVIPLTYSRQYPEWLFPGKTQYEPEGAERRDAPKRILDSLNPLTWLATARHVRTLDSDALIFQHWMPFFAPALGTIVRSLGRCHVPSVAVVHNALPHEQQPGTAALTRYGLGACKGLVTMSEAVERDVRSTGVEVPIRRVPHPVYEQFGVAPDASAARERLSLPEGAPVLLFFGFVRRYKGLQVLLEAMPQVVEALPGVRLVVAGEFYEKADPYLQQIREYGLEPYVSLHDRYIPGDEVGVYFAAADVVVQPYVLATQSGVAQVAFHFEKPLIVTDVGGLAEVVPDGRAGLVVPPNDPGVLAAAIIRFFQEQLAASLVEGVREEKQKYSWDRLYEALESFL